MLQGADMSHEINKFRLGLFFSIGSLIFIVFLIWLVGGFREKSFDRYVSYFSVSVQGLTSNSNVLYNGVHIGRVSDISVAPDGRLVQVTMDIESSFRVDSTITAAIHHVGISGLMVINLQSDSTSTGMNGVLLGLTFEPPYPTIPVTAGTVESITTCLERLAQISSDIDFREIGDQTDRFLQHLNRLFGGVPIDSLLVALQEASSWLNSQIPVWNRFGVSMFVWSEDLIPEIPGFTSSIKAQTEGITFFRELNSLLSAITEVLIPLHDQIVELRKHVNSLRN